MKDICCKYMIKQHISKKEPRQTYKKKIKMAQKMDKYLK